MKICHIASGLRLGGAESAMFRVIERTRQQFQHTVISLSDDGYFATPLRHIGVEVSSIRLGSTLGVPGAIARLAGALRRAGPDVIQTWMYHADLIGGVTAKAVSSAPVIWNVRNSDLDPNRTSWSTRLAVRVCARLSGRVPKRIICCARSSIALHARLGYQRELFHWIPNGVDLAQFRPDPGQRLSAKNALGVDPREFLIGMVARWHPQKDHESLLKALSLLKLEGLPFRCALVGTGMDHQNVELAKLVEMLGLRPEILLCGPRADVHALMPGFDLHAMPSAYGEAHSNAIVEALACGVPSVVTPVGDSQAIVGDSGWVVPVRSPRELASSIRHAYELAGSESYEARRVACRSRAQQHFDANAMVDEYIRVWRDAAQAAERSTR